MNTWRRSWARLLQGTVLLSCLCLQSCFTTALWTLDLDGNRSSRRSSKREVTRGSIVYPQGVNYHYRDEDLPPSRKQKTESSIGFKLIATPFALLLDLITLPIQSLLDDDC